MFKRISLRSINKEEWLFSRRENEFVGFKIMRIYNMQLWIEYVWGRGNKVNMKVKKNASAKQYLNDSAHVRVYHTQYLHYNNSWSRQILSRETSSSPIYTSSTFSATKKQILLDTCRICIMRERCSSMHRRKNP